MTANLSGLIVGDESAHGDKAPIARYQRRPQPEVAEQEVRCVLYESRRDVSKVGAYLRRALFFRFLVDGQQLFFDGRKMVHIDAALVEEVFRTATAAMAFAHPA